MACIDWEEADMRSLKPLSTAFLTAALALGLAVHGKAKQTPLFQGTVFVAPDLILADDPSNFLKIRYKGQAERSMFDRRLDGWKTYSAYLFEASFKDSTPIEMQVNPEFGNVQAASAEAEKYARAIGQLPSLLRAGVKTSWIHKGKELYGGGNDNILVHTGQTVEYESQGVMEEALLHEATHTTLDGKHAQAPRWSAAQKSDPAFPSDYAEKNPAREDLAESYLLYLAVKYKPGRLPAGYQEKIERGIPARLAYLHSVPGKLSPFAKR
jgi:hypothetical protein